MPTKRLSSVRPPPADGRPKNRLLAALPPDVFGRLQPHLTTISIRKRQVLHKQGEPLRYVYFPNGGVCSVTTLLPSGAMVEAATIGDEGLVGIEAFFTDEAKSRGQTLVQVPNESAERLPVVTFRGALAERGPLHDVCARYAQFVIAQMMQSTACNALHQVQQRCARWLLMTHDRMHQQDFNLSHDFLAIMLGVHRPTVSAIAGTLQASGLIGYRHGHVTVKNRKGLEAASCECYGAIRAQYEQLGI